MAVLYHPSLDPSRIYYGTDTRAAGLLFGAALAMVWPSRRLSQRITRRRPQHARRARRRRPADHRDHDLADRRVLPVPLPRRLRRALAGDGDGVDAARPPGLPARQHRRLQAAALDRRPLLRHLPLADAGDRPHLPRRHRQRRRTCCASSSRSRRSSSSRRSPGNSSRSRSATARSAASGERAPASAGGRGDLLAARAGDRRRSASSSSSPPAPAWPGVNTASAEGKEIRVKEAIAAGDQSPVPLTPAQAADSTTLLLQSRRPHRRLDLRGPRLARIPAARKSGSKPGTPKSASKKRTWRLQGARSIEERFEGEPNAQEVAEAWKAEGYKGCWVLALGTNEAADVAAGSSVGERNGSKK